MKRLAVLLILLAAQFSFAQTKLNSMPDLSGRYIMDIQIGDKLFKDIVDLEGKDGPIPLYMYKGPLKGTLTVVGSFSSPLEGYASCSAWAAVCSVNFSIIANENGKSFKVIYKAKLENFFDFQDGPAVLTGSAYLENGELLGNFKAVQEIKNP